MATRTYEINDTPPTLPSLVKVDVQELITIPSTTYTLTALDLTPANNKLKPYIDELILVKKGIQTNQNNLALFRGNFNLEVNKLINQRSVKVRAALLDTLDEVAALEARLAKKVQISYPELQRLYTAKIYDIPNMQRMLLQQSLDVTSSLVRELAAEYKDAGILTAPEIANYLKDLLGPLVAPEVVVDSKKKQELDLVQRTVQLQKFVDKNSSPSLLNEYYEKNFLSKMILFDRIDEYAVAERDTTLRYDDRAPQPKAQLLQLRKDLLVSMITYPEPNTNLASYQNLKVPFDKLMEIYKHPDFTTPYYNQNSTTTQQRIALGWALDNADGSRALSTKENEQLAANFIGMLNVKDVSKQDFSRKGFYMNITALQGSNATEAKFNEAVFPINYSLKNATLNKATFINAQMPFADLTGVKANEAKFNSTNAKYLNLTNATATKADFSDAVLEGAKLVNGNFTESVFSRSNLGTAKLNGSDFTGTRFFKTDAASADAIGTNFTGGVMTNGSRFSFTDFTDAKLTQVVAQDTSFYGATFTRTDLSGFISVGTTDFTRANFMQANLDNASFPGVNFQDATIKNTVGQLVNFADSNLSGATLSGVYLENVNLRNTNLSGVSIVNSNLSQTDFSKATGSLKTVNGSDLSKSYFNGNKTLLKSANLTGADLSMSDLRGADLSNATIGNAKLKGAIYREADIVTDIKDDKGNFIIKPKTVFPKGFDPIKAGMISESQIERQMMAAQLKQYITGFSNSFDKAMTHQDNVQALFKDVDDLQKAGKPGGDDSWFSYIVYLDFMVGYERALFTDSNLSNQSVKTAFTDVFAKLKDLEAAVGNVKKFNNLYKEITGYTADELTEKHQDLQTRLKGYYENGVFAREDLSATLAQHPLYVKENLIKREGYSLVSIPEATIKDIKGETAADKAFRKEALKTETVSKYLDGLASLPPDDPKRKEPFVLQYGKTYYLIKFLPPSNPPTMELADIPKSMRVVDIPRGDTVETYTKFLSTLPANSPSRKLPFVLKVLGSDSKFVYYKITAVPLSKPEALKTAAAGEMAEITSTMLKGMLGEAKDKMMKSFESKDKYVEYKKGLDQMVVWLVSGVFGTKGLITAPLINADIAQDYRLKYQRANGMPYSGDMLSFMRYMDIAAGYAAVPAMSLGGPTNKLVTGAIGNNIIGRAVGSLAGHFMAGAFLTFNESYVRQSATDITWADQWDAVKTSISLMPKGGLHMMLFGGMLDAAMAAPMLALKGSFAGLKTLKSFIKDAKDPSVAVWYFEQQKGTLDATKKEYNGRIDTLEQQLVEAQKNKADASVIDMLTKAISDAKSELNKLSDNIELNNKQLTSAQQTQGATTLPAPAPTGPKSPVTVFNKLLTKLEADLATLKGQENPTQQQKTLMDALTKTITKLTQLRDQIQAAQDKGVAKYGSVGETLNIKPEDVFLEVLNKGEDVSFLKKFLEEISPEIVKLIPKDDAAETVQNILYILSSASSLSSADRKSILTNLVEKGFPIENSGNSFTQNKTSYLYLLYQEANIAFFQGKTVTDILEDGKLLALAEKIGAGAEFKGTLTKLEALLLTPPSAAEILAAKDLFPTAEMGTKGFLKQANIGDCWLVSSLGTILNNPTTRALLMKMIRPLGNGLYEVTLPGLQQPMIIDSSTVTRKLDNTTYKLAEGADPGVEIIMLTIAKAWKIQAGKEGDTLQWANNGAQASIPLSMLTGLATKTIKFDKPTGLDTVLGQIADNGNKFLTNTSSKTETVPVKTVEGPTVTPLGGHAYSILSVKKVGTGPKDLVIEVWDPHNKKYSLTYEDFMKNFENIEYIPLP